MQAIVYIRVAFSAAFSNKKVGRLVTKEVSWALITQSELARTKKMVGSDNLRSETCVEYLVSVTFFRQV